MTDTAHAALYSTTISRGDNYYGRLIVIDRLLLLISRRDLTLNCSIYSLFMHMMSSTGKKMLSKDQNKLELPIINISSLDEDIGELLVAAAAKYGFVYIKSTGLGIGAETVDKIFALVSPGVQSNNNETHG